MSGNAWNVFLLMRLLKREKVLAMRRLCKKNNFLGVVAELARNYEHCHRIRQTFHSLVCCHTLKARRLGSGNSFVVASFRAHPSFASLASEASEASFVAFLACVASFVAFLACMAFVAFLASVAFVAFLASVASFEAFLALVSFEAILASEAYEASFVAFLACVASFVAFLACVAFVAFVVAFASSVVGTWVFGLRLADNKGLAAWLDIAAPFHQVWYNSHLAIGWQVEDDIVAMFQKKEESEFRGAIRLVVRTIGEPKVRVQVETVL